MFRRTREPPHGHMSPLPHTTTAQNVFAQFTTGETEELHPRKSRGFFCTGQPAIMFPIERNSIILSAHDCSPHMTALTPAQVRHIAKLARLELKDDEVEKYAKELSAILKYIEELQTVDTEGVEPTAQVTGQKNVFRDDVIRSDLANPDALLGTSPLLIREHQIQTPSAHG